MIAEVIKSFIDKHTGEVYEIGKHLNISEERYKEMNRIPHLQLVEKIKNKEEEEIKDDIRIETTTIDRPVPDVQHTKENRIQRNKK